ncbi:hypothetical protein GOBAR_AA31416 [Gossypium barbadense]|uniref:Uncharacterized protein n=1 Tax=Gossypium barbadense TaxID=3634 RepID=A0A2P5WDV7_GOSBA|nr:hypothetical protein GOBAR_AA31416 [Gossypium barbadense]
MSLKEVHDSFSSSSRGPVHEDRRLQIEELDEWWMHKPRTPDKPKLCQNKPDTSPNQLKVGDKVLLDASDPHIVTTTPNEETLLTVLSIFQFSTVDVSHPKFDTFKVSSQRHGQSHGRASEQVQMAGSIRALLTTDPWELFFEIIEPTYLELTMELCSMFHLQALMTRYDDPDTVQFCLGTRESTGIINTHDVYFLWCMSQGHVIDLAYFIALAIQHQTEQHRKGVISIGPYVTRLERHFGLLNIVAQKSSLTLISQMSPQGISSMLSMRMIESTRAHRLSDHHPLVQFMWQLHMLTSLSASTDLSSIVFNDLTTLMLLYSRFVNTSTSHRQSHLANHPAMKMTYGLMNLYDCRSILLHPRTNYSPKL